jgi:hypothetical protein
MSARTRTELESLHPRLRPLVDERVALLDAPLVGVTSDGVAVGGLYAPGAGGTATTGPLLDAAQRFLAALSPAQRAQATFPLDAPERRTWINVHMNFFRHGVMLEDLDGPTRQLGLELLRATLSARGYGQARDIMRLNELIGHLSGSYDEYGEWPYFVSFFGEPSADAPWGWQIDGHHLNINAFVVDDRLVTTPTFMGAEPTSVDAGPFAGTRVFMAEERTGLDLVRSLDAAQAAKAIVRPSIGTADLPRELQHPFDGRMQAGAFHDNAVLPYDGIRATDLTDAQRRLLRGVLSTYVGWLPDGHTEARMREVEANLDETWFAWMGSTGDGAFYYRVHSPVVVVEFDHHPGVVFDNDEPSRHHVHTVVRTPNGGDYGADLLRQHYERVDHGRH